MLDKWLRMNQGRRDKASKYWKEGKALEAGRLIFEDLPKIMRPKWAANILKALVDRTGLSSPATQRILTIVDDPRQWAEGHAAFRQARREVSQLSDLPVRSPKQELMLSQMMVAELVAKVTYNETDPDDEFDEDSGWWMAPCLLDVVDTIGDADFRLSMWSMLIRDDLA